MKGKLLRSIAVLLMATMLVPNISVKGLTNEMTEVIQENVTNNINNDELINSKYEFKEDQIQDTYSTKNYERYEFELKAAEFDQVTTLEVKTDNNYEVAIARTDGSYYFVDSANTVDEAIKIAEDVETQASKTKNARAVSYAASNTGFTEVANTLENMPVVINEQGQVVYSTLSMARIYKHINGKPYQNFDKNTNVYPDSTMKGAFTYINHGYVDDAPIIAFNGEKSAKIMVNGYEGWINMDKTSADYDMIVVPLNQVKNPSYYYVEGGILKHFITSNITDGTSGYSINIGKAPAYLAAGVKYFSYDGKYFYDGRDMVVGLTNLITDYQSSKREKAVNAAAPYYSYYLNLPFRSKTIYSADALNRFISENASADSKLIGAGQALKDAEKTYGVNALLALGVAINESAWGTSSIAKSKNNIFGLNAVDSNPGLAANEFPSVAACISDFTKNWISRGYADPADWRYYGSFLGNKALGANVKYASDPFWGEKAAKYALQVDLYLSGDVNSLQDTDVYQLGVYSGVNEVRNKNNILLYNINDNFNEYSSYVGVPFVLTYPEVMSINGRDSYEIYADRNTAVNNGGTDNKFQGNYNWADKGYINATGVTFINTKRDVKPVMELIGGNNRFETSVELSKSKFTTANTVVLVNESAIIDGVTSSALATALNAPILLSRKSNLEESIKAEIKRLGTKKVILIGDSGVLDAGVINDVKALGITDITQLGGKSRYDTALEVAKYIDANCYDVTQVFVVNGRGEADALSAGAISGQNRIPILLTESNSLNPQVKNFLASESLDTGYIIGGSSVVSENVVNELNAITKNNVSGNRIGGKNRYETNALVIEKFYGSELNSVYVSKGLVLIDALTAGPIAAIDGSPIVIVDKDLEQIQRDVLLKRCTNRIVQAGRGISTNAVNSLRNIMNIFNL